MKPLFAVVPLMAVTACSQPMDTVEFSCPKDQQIDQCLESAGYKLFGEEEAKAEIEELTKDFDTMQVFDVEYPLVSDVVSGEFIESNGVIDFTLGSDDVKELTESLVPTAVFTLVQDGDSYYSINYRRVADNWVLHESSIAPLTKEEWETKAKYQTGW